jgi:Raf kinase inhibitor-like YbhB/YbcL family protein
MDKDRAVSIHVCKLVVRFLFLLIAWMLLFACGTSSPEATEPATEPGAQEQVATPSTDEQGEAVDEVIPSTEQVAESVEISEFKLTSDVFVDGDQIPSIYSCDGGDTSPALTWEGVPEESKSLVLVMDDPDAPGGTWIHWVLFNIPAQVSQLPASIPANAELADGSLHGQNSWGRSDYGGPCPPSGTHRYYFKLFALDTELNLKPGATVDEVYLAMKDHVLAETALMGTYSR